jgi:lipopolysaccharide/colanic/teichoic acid biosynthesis glycosyltransferase
MARDRDRVVKRVIDVVLSSVALLMVSPGLVAAAILIVLEDRGPVLFRQSRAGLGSREFEVLKLRTMRIDTPSPEMLGEVGIDHPMVTRVGRLLRRFKIDELPQLVNVLRGEMSLVGPRPALSQLARSYDGFACRRLSVPPGVSGWAQVSGNAGLSWEERIVLDVWYVDHWSLHLDAVILFKTLGVVLRGERRHDPALREAHAHANGARRSG